MYTPSNAFELFEAYKNFYQKDKTSVSLVRKTQMTLLHFVIPILGGAALKGKRSTQAEIKAAMSFLQKISLEQFFDVTKLVLSFMKEKNISKNKQKEYWTYLKKLIKWSDEQQYIIKSKSNIVNINVLGQPVNPKYAIGYCFGDYMTLALHNQIEDYRKFLIEERGLCSNVKSSVNANLSITNLLLGWLHREKNVLLDDLCLESIVPLVKTKLDIADLKNASGKINKKAYLDAKQKFEQQAKDKNLETLFLIKNFLDVKSKALRTKLNIIAAVINIAKFIYKNDTNTTKASNFEDIEIIKLLRELRREEIAKFNQQRKNNFFNNA